MSVCDFGGERQSSAAEVIVVMDVLVPKRCGGCQTHVLDEDGDHHGVSGESVQVGEEQLRQGSGDVICVAYRDPDNGGEYDEICLGVRAIFGRVMDEFWRSSKCDREE